MGHVPGWQYVGCYIDNPPWMVKYFTGDVSNLDECRKKADHWGRDVFAVSDNRRCWIDSLSEAKPDRVFDRYGRAPDAQCKNVLGG